MMIADEDIPAGSALTVSRILAVRPLRSAVVRKKDGLGPCGVADRDYRKGEVITPTFAARLPVGPIPPP